MKQINKQVLYSVAIVATTLGVYIGFQYLLPLALPFLFAYWLARIIEPIVNWSRKHLHCCKGIAGSISLLVIFLLLGIALFYLGKILIEQLTIFIGNLPTYNNLLLKYLTNFSLCCDDFLRLKQGSVQLFMEQNISTGMDWLKTEMIPKITDQSVKMAFGFFQWGFILFIVFIAAFILITDKEQMKQDYENTKFYTVLHDLLEQLSEKGIAYLKAQGILLLIICTICIIGFCFIRNKYALLLGIGIAIFDSFPILGSGLILVPWAVIMLLSKNLYEATILISVYLLCQFTRQFLEPKLVGNKLGISPFYTLMSIYSGVRLFGVSGFILGPIALVLIRVIIFMWRKQIYKE